jgi:biofilm PGA synthesis N-glycosyltransferase PgaC
MEGRVADMTSYVLISPVRNESKNVEGIIKSVCNQIILPQKWIIIDDGSTDGTRQILAQQTRAYDWIEVFHREVREDRALGNNIVAILEEGLHKVEHLNWDYWGKVDADVAFGEQYFSSLFQSCEENSALGIVSGNNYLLSARGDYKIEWSTNEFPIGGARLYRRDCWRDIGGYAPRRFWDVIDVYTAQLRGWKTRSFSELPVYHARPVDARQSGQIQRRFNHGINSYEVGYDLLFYLLRSMRAIWDEKPFFIAGSTMIMGYIYALLSRAPIYDEELMNFIRHSQRSRITISEFLSYLSGRESKVADINQH